MSEPNPEAEASEQRTPDPDAENDVGISDEQLPEDLQPSDDNPLAKPPDDDEESGMSLGADGPEAGSPG